jgi:hypothetical protein
MQVRSQRYVRRRRTAEEDGTPTSPNILRPRRRATRFDGHSTTTPVLFDVTAEDDEIAVETAQLLAPKAEEIADEVFNRMLAHLNRDHQLVDGVGSSGDDASTRRRDFRDWVDAMIREPAAPATSERSAGIALSYARPPGALSSPIPARYLLSAIGHLQASMLSRLAASYDDVQQLARVGSVWNRRLLMHGDVLLAVYGASAGKPHWY